MLILTFITDTDPYILQLNDERWKFSIHVRNDGKYDNVVTITHLYKSFHNVPEVIALSNYLRDNKEHIIKFNLAVNTPNNIVFDSEEMNVTYHNVFLQQRMNPTASVQDITNSYDLGFSCNIIFSRPTADDSEEEIEARETELQNETE